jgi:hypothetical protein
MTRPPKNDAMTEAELQKFQRGLAHLSPQTVFVGLSGAPRQVSGPRPASAAFDAGDYGALETSLEVAALS